jgi:hypothetical protein
VSLGWLGLAGKGGARERDPCAGGIGGEVRHEETEEMPIDDEGLQAAGDGLVAESLAATRVQARRGCGRRG